MIESAAVKSCEPAGSQDLAFLRAASAVAGQQRRSSRLVKRPPGNRAVTCTLP